MAFVDSQLVRLSFSRWAAHTEISYSESGTITDYRFGITYAKQASQKEVYWLAEKDLM